MDQQEQTKNLPITWAEKFKDYTQAQRSKEKNTGGKFFSIKAGVLSFDGAPIPNNQVDVVVLESIHERTYYPDAYGSSDARAPACYSFAPDGAFAGPHPEAAKPQSKTCKGCPHDKWGSGNNGKGKACREGRRLALLSATDCADPEKVAGGTIAYMRVPVMSVKGFSAYVQGVTAVSELPLFFHITRVKVQPDPKIQIRVTFEPIGVLKEDAVIDAVFGRASAEAENITFPYPKMEEGDDAPAKKRKF